jgi:hypothetical protein
LRQFRRVHADAADARQLDRRMADVEPCDQREQVDLDSFDPAGLDAEQAVYFQFEAGLARCRAEPASIGAIVLADGGRR